MGSSIGWAIVASVLAFGGLTVSGEKPYGDRGAYEVGPSAK